MSRSEDRSGVSPKVTLAALGAALSAFIWILLAAFVGPVRENMDQSAVTAVTGATSTILAFGLGYFVRDPGRR